MWKKTQQKLTRLIKDLSNDKDFHSGSDGEESGCNAGDLDLIPGLLGSGDPWRRDWLPSPVFLPGEFHGQRSLEGYSPWGHRESDTNE